jgi:hypothetical protein
MKIGKQPAASDGVNEIMKLAKEEINVGETGMGINRENVENVAMAMKRNELNSKQNNNGGVISASMATMKASEKQWRRNQRRRNIGVISQQRHQWRHRPSMARRQ